MHSPLARALDTAKLFDTRQSRYQDTRYAPRGYSQSAAEECRSKPERVLMRNGQTGPAAFCETAVPPLKVKTQRVRQPVRVHATFGKRILVEVLCQYGEHAEVRTVSSGRVRVVLASRLTNKTLSGGFGG